ALLVASHGLDQKAPIDRANARGKIGARDDLLERPRDARRRDAKPLAEPRGEGHPDRHGLSVEKLAIALRGLDSVSKRMPEIEDHPQIGLALILLDDARLARHRSRDDIRKGAPIQSIEARTVGCHPL